MLSASFSSPRNKSRLETNSAVVKLTPVLNPFQFLTFNFIIIALKNDLRLVILPEVKPVHTAFYDVALTMTTAKTLVLLRITAFQSLT